MDEEDVTTEWEALKRRPLDHRSRQSDDVNLPREWMALADHPSHVYWFTEAQYGLRHMVIWRLRCIGQKHYKSTSPMLGRRGDCWIVRYDVPLWLGEQASVKGVHPERFFPLSKRHAFTTLDETREAFVKLRDKHMASYQERRLALLADLSRLEAEIADGDAHASRMASFIPHLDQSADV